MSLTVGSLFSGCGALDLGLERAGMTIRWQVEIDDFARRVLAKQWPDVPRHGDIRGLQGDELDPVDLICGGPPCQPVSHAGARRGAADDRWLWPEFARLVGVVRPRYVLVENVPGLLRRGMGDVLGDLSALGFDAEWSVVSACSLGAPHTRERVFIVAYAPGERREWGRGPGTGSPLLEPQGRGQEYRRPWAPESRPRGVAYGVADRVHRLRLIGNGVVPQVAEDIGRRILEVSGCASLLRRRSRPAAATPPARPAPLLRRRDVPAAAAGQPPGLPPLVPACAGHVEHRGRPDRPRGLPDLAPDEPQAPRLLLEGGTVSKRAFPIVCKSCGALGLYPRDVKSGDWVYVLDEPPYALCGSCHLAVVRSVLPTTHPKEKDK